MDAFINAASGMHNVVGELLREIFIGGPSITLSVTEEQIWKIMRVIFARRRGNFPQTNNSVLLEALHELLLVRL